MPPHRMSGSSSSSSSSASVPGNGRTFRMSMGGKQPSSESNKALERIGAVLNGRTEAPLDGTATAWISTISRDIQRAVEMGQESERETLWERYEELCEKHGHRCHVCREALPPGGDDGTRAAFAGTGACEHVGNSHFHCLFRGGAYILTKTSFDVDNNTTSFFDGSYYEPVSDGFCDVRPCDAVLFKCPTCSKETKITLPSFKRTGVGYDERSQKFRTRGAPHHPLPPSNVDLTDDDPPLSPSYSPTSPGGYAPESPSYSPASPYPDPDPAPISDYVPDPAPISDYVPDPFEAEGGEEEEDDEEEEEDERVEPGAIERDDNDPEWLPS